MKNTKLRGDLFIPSRGALAPPAGLIVLPFLAGLLMLPGCGGGGGGSSDTVRNPPPVTVQKTGTFYSPFNNVLVGSSTLVHVARGYVTLNNGVPSAVGMELSDQAVKELPLPPHDTPAIFGVNLPPEAAYTIFTYLAFSQWSGHPPAGIGEVPHFHPLFGIGPPQTADPPDFRRENMPVPSDEIPQDHLPTTGPDAIAPGIGLAYQDPRQPQAQPGWNTTGQNYFFINGRMNAYGLGATNDFLLSRVTRSDIIKQPRRYPLPGYYPHRYTVSYNAARNVHVFVLEDFHQATQVNIQP